MPAVPPYDAVLVVSFGGPEAPDEVLPFLENVTRGRAIPRERLADVASHYLVRGGVSPINGQNRQLITALEAELNTQDRALPVYWGNRNWHPLLADTVATMTDHGVRHAIAFVTSAFSSYSGCRQYLDDLAGARLAVGPDAPVIDKIRPYFNHPGFIEPMAENVAEALARLPESQRGTAELVFTAHSIPESMAATSDYVAQIEEACRLVADRLEPDRSWSLAFQSRSGSPAQRWLGPDICEHLGRLHERGTTAVVVAPIGFVSDHMEVVHDLDTEAADRATELGLAMVRAATVGTAPAFVAMIAELIDERVSPETSHPRALGTMGPRPGDCSEGCCPRPSRPATSPAAAVPPPTPLAGAPTASAGNPPAPSPR